MSAERTRLIHNGTYHNVTITTEGDYIYIQSGYNPSLTNELKVSLSGAHWCGFDKNPRKVWRFKNDLRTRFRLAFLKGEDPYEKYDAPLPEWPTNRTLYQHQRDMSSHWYSRNYALIAGEMGTGKTLAALEVAERVFHEQNLRSSFESIWYVGPKTGVSAIKREIKKWGFSIEPRCFTYEGLTKELKNWDPNTRTPTVLIGDESSKLKTPTSQRSQAFDHIAKAIIEEHGPLGYVVEMSGTPSPKEPVDWWFQCEILCPGFLREASVQALKRRLSIIEERESAAGGVYPHLVAWKDREDICGKCGKAKDHDTHKPVVMHTILGTMQPNPRYHKYEECINEVEHLHKRMAGLVHVSLKKDCLDLPEKQYIEVKIKPTVDVLRAARTIKATSPRAIQALTLLRELSDGFQYSEEKIGMEECPTCYGQKVLAQPVVLEEASTNAEIHRDQFEMEEDICPHCGGVGEIPKYKRSRLDVDSPKDDALIDLLGDFDESGRIVIWGGFSATIDKLVELCQDQGWAVLRYDQKIIGYAADGTEVDPERLLDAMDGSHPDKKELALMFPKIAFVGHPQAGGMGLTLTASNAAIYYSNVFSGEARIQSEDRIHRAGMDSNRGCMIYDFIHLPTDRLVLDNLQKKRNLQAITMGDLMRD